MGQRAGPANRAIPSEIEQVDAKLLDASPTRNRPAAAKATADQEPASATFGILQGPLTLLTGPARPLEAIANRARNFHTQQLRMTPHRLVPADRQGLTADHAHL